MSDEMGDRPLDDIEGLTAADVVHRRLTSMPASTTVGELRDYFAASTSRRVAVLVDGERFVGSVTAAALRDDLDAAAPAADLAAADPHIEAGAPAATARDRAMALDSLRLPVVDDDGRLVGVVAINKRRDAFCGTQAG